MDISEQTVIINPHAMLPVGTLLQNGKYRIERHLSSGGFGNTYVATNIEFEEQVAIKEFFIRGVSERDGDSVSVSVSNRDNVEQFSSQKEKFKKEARRLRRMKNEHIVSVHDLFEENGTAYYEMELIKGESLSDRLKRTGQPLSEEEVLNILNQVLDALSIVHAQGLYHLDLKPGNIMVDDSGRTLLIDFGASKQMQSGEGHSLSTSSALAFTPGYAPLEQTEQNMKNFGPWTDLYALGATLYKLLTNLTPPSASDILMSVTPLEYPQPVSSRMKQLINWMMKPSPGERPKSVSDVREFLAVEAEEEQTIEDKESITNEEDDLTRTVIEPKEEKSDNILLDETIKVDKMLSSSQKKEDAVYSVNGVSFTMIRIEGGTFMMGNSGEQDLEAWTDEGPIHKVTLNTFSIGETAVTQELWMAVMDNNSSVFNDLNNPVEFVSWNECHDFINRLNSITGLKFRLPTEAEWEYAARGGKYSSGFKYAGDNSLNDVGWFKGNSNGMTHNVGTKNANELGLYDMSGNVMEWCEDWYGSYSFIPQRNPTGPDSGDKRVARGGSWNDNARNARVSMRASFFPYLKGSNLGFRLVLNEEQMSGNGS